MIKNHKDNFINKFKNNGYFTLIVVILLIVSTTYLGQLSEEYGIKIIIISSAFVIAQLLIIFLFFQKPVVGNILEKIENLINNIRISPLNWLFTTEQLVNYEKGLKKSDVHEIWLISSDLLDDEIDGPFYNVVQTNLKKKIKYVYFVPKSNSILARINSIHTLHKNNPLLKIIHLPEDFFFLVPNLDICIYNPLNNGKLKKKAYMGLPSIDTELHMHADMSKEFIDSLVGQLLKIYNEEIEWEN